MMENPIILFFHCAQCQDENVAPQDQDKSVGYTEDGELAVWCEIHDSLIKIWELKNPPEPADLVCDECGRSYT